MTEKIMNKKYLQSPWLIVSVVLACLFVIGSISVYKLSEQNKALHAEITDKIENSKKVYIYDLETVVASSNLVVLKQEFENKIQELSKELDTAKKKIKTIKDSKVKADFSDVYLNSLKLKRDDTVKAYDEVMVRVTENINIAVKEVADKLETPTIFNAKSIAIKTKYVIDLTPQIAELVKQKNATLRMP